MLHFFKVKRKKDKIMTEIWKDVPGYEGHYEVSNLGQVRSIERTTVNPETGRRRWVRQQMLKPGDRKGYKIVKLHKDHKSRMWGVHQIVACAFLGHKRCGYDMVVDHVDNNPSNNTLENLQVITQRLNSSKDVKNKTSKYTGVHTIPNSNKFKATITVKGKMEYLGLFKTEEEASAAYQKRLHEIE